MNRTAVTLLRCRRASSLANLHKESSANADGQLGGLVYHGKTEQQYFNETYSRVEAEKNELHLMQGVHNHLNRENSSISGLTEENCMSELASCGQMNLGDPVPVQHDWQQNSNSITDLKKNYGFLLHHTHSSKGVDLGSAMAPGNVPKASNLNNSNLSYWHFPKSSAPLQSKFIMSSRTSCHHQRALHTSAIQSELISEDVGEENKYEAWLSACRAYQLGYADAVTQYDSGKVTVDQLILEQQSVLDHIAHFHQTNSGDAAEELALPARLKLLDQLQAPTDESMRYKMWLANCLRFRFQDSHSQLTDWQEGRCTLEDLLKDQDSRVRAIVEHFRQQIRVD